MQPQPQHFIPVMIVMYHKIRTAWLDWIQFGSIQSQFSVKFSLCKENLIRDVHHYSALGSHYSIIEQIIVLLMQVEAKIKAYVAH